MEPLLPDGEQEHQSYIDQIVALYSCLLPFTEVDHQNKQKFVNLSFRPVQPDETLLKQLNDLDD